MKYFHSLYLKHKKFWNHQRGIFLLEALLMFVLALMVQKFADMYTSKVVGIPVGDLILSHLPTIDIDFLIVQGALVLTLIVLLLLITRPRYITFTAKAFAIFIIVRSASICLTHLGQDPKMLAHDVNSIGYGIYNVLYNSKNDFFFSGHTGTPFLMALIFWKDKFWRDLFILISITFAIAVLLAHVHYSIDVFAAPFMTYSIFAISKHLFPHDYELIKRKS